MSRRSQRRGSGRAFTVASRHRLPMGRIASIERLENRCLLAASAYTWQNAAIGAGGFVDGIFYDPNIQNVIYARTDIGGLYKTTDDGQHWTQLLDFVGNSTGTSGNGTQFQLLGVLAFAIDPQNSNNIYADVGEYTGGTNPSGAVFYSTNGGQSWNSTALAFQVGGNSNGRGDGEQIQVDPNNSNIVFLGSNTGGLWKSTDAGHSFSKISGGSSGLSTNLSTTFVLFDPASGTPGNASQTIYLGANSTSSGTNLYRSTNGGTSWTQVAITSGSGPTGFLPGHAVLSGGNMYLGYGNAETPNGSITNGGVYRYTPSTGAWANITPVATAGHFGYDSVAADPQNPITVVVTSFNYYSGPDQIWRTVNANVATPTWTEIYDLSQQQNFGYGAYNLTRDSSNAPYAAGSGDGISNWAASVAINPFNSNQLMYGTGQGIWATNNVSNGGTNTKLTAPNSWYFPDYGIEFTAVGGVATALTGVPLFSAMGDIFGFAHTTLTSSPAQGDAAPFGSANNVDAANNVIAIVGNSNSHYGYYSTNDGQTFQAFPTSPGTGNTYGTDTVAVSANGLTIVWAQSGQVPYYTTNYGTTWTASGGGMAANGQIVADRVNPNDFYYHVGNSLYFSNNGGVSFTLQSNSVPTGGTLVANPFTSGDLWYAGSGGIYHSSNFGLTFSHPASSLTASNGVMALGAPAPGQTLPAIYVFGNVGGFLGVYRSDDGALTWTQLNDVNHQWGGLLQTFAADPNVFGRVYIGINGRGIIMGNPATSLPSGWIDGEIDTPGTPGWSTTSTTLSTGTTVNQWIVNGGGAGITGNNFSINSLTYTQPTTGQFYVTAVTSAPHGLHIGDTVTIAGASPAGFNGTFAVAGIVNSTTFTYDVVPGAASATGTITGTTKDQFHFTYRTLTGGGSISAQLLSMTNADGTAGTPQAGVMFRAGTSNGDVFASLMQTADNQLLFQTRITTGGSVTTTSLGSVPVGAEYVELTRSGNSFASYYSADGVNWTQLGSSVAIAAMPATADVGLAATANFNSQLTSATFANVVVHLKGDINLDGHVNAADIGALMQALADTNTYQTTNNLSPTEAVVVADVSGDGFVNNFDLQALLSQLISGGGSSSQGENASAPMQTPTTPSVSTLIASGPASNATTDLVSISTTSSIGSQTPATPPATDEAPGTTTAQHSANKAIASFVVGRPKTDFTGQNNLDQSNLSSAADPSAHPCTANVDKVFMDSDQFVQRRIPVLHSRPSAKSEDSDRDLLHDFWQEYPLESALD